MRGVVEGRRAPECIRRRGQVERLGGRCGRMRVERIKGVVERGEEMVSGRSGSEVVKRTIKVSGGSEGGDGKDEVMAFGIVRLLKG